MARRSCSSRSKPVNIFVFDEDPWLSALWLDDVRKNKMILETAQLLSTAIQFNDPFTDLKVYKPAYISHPCTIWARTSRDNFNWLTEYMRCLVVQKKTGHKSAELLASFEHYGSHGRFSLEQRTPFANCARNRERGVDFSHVADVHSAYRQYICRRWQERTITLSWRWGKEPEWRE